MVSLFTKLLEQSNSVGSKMRGFLLNLTISDLLHTLLSGISFKGHACKGHDYLKGALASLDRCFNASFIKRWNFEHSRWLGARHSAACRSPSLIDDNFLYLFCRALPLFPIVFVYQLIDYFSQ